jgi:hypothetical protein
LRVLLAVGVGRHHRPAFAERGYPIFTFKGRASLLFEAAFDELAATVSPLVGAAHDRELRLKRQSTPHQPRLLLRRTRSHGRPAVQPSTRLLPCVGDRKKRKPWARGR